MLELLIALTLFEIVLVLGVLLYYLMRIVASLRRTSETLAKVGFGVRAIEKQVSSVGPALERVNGTLAAVADAAPALVESAERLAGTGRSDA
ncbi:MAG: hypothetical protein R3320_00765 [Nitriliruptorales bacterium]|nr:hypothetical protein [Nitriliruptorales bacterium]